MKNRAAQESSSRDSFHSINENDIFHTAKAESEIEKVSNHLKNQEVSSAALEFSEDHFDQNDNKKARLKQLDYLVKQDSTDNKIIG